MGLSAKHGTVPGFRGLSYEPTWYGVPTPADCYMCMAGIYVYGSNA